MKTGNEIYIVLYKIRIQIEMVSSGTFSLDEIAEHLPRTNEIDEKSHSKFLLEFSDDEAIQSRVREIFVVFTTKIYELVNPYMELVDQEQEDDSEEDSGINSDDHEVIDPANIGIERCFGTMKFFEDRFKSLTFGALSQLTIAKCNKLTDHVSDLSDEDLLNANRLARQDQRASRESVLHQRDMIRSNNERRLTKVIEIIFVSFKWSYKDTETAVKLESGVEFIINDHSLIPKSDLSDIGTKRTKFNSQRKLADQNNRAFGAE